MNKREENKYTMYQLVERYFNENVLNQNPSAALVECIMRFSELIGEIGEQVRIQMTKSNGYSIQKKKERDEMISKMIEISGAIHAYAFMIQDNELRVKVKVTKKKLVLMRDTELAIRCRENYKMAKELNGKIEEYGVTSELLNTFDKEIKDYEELISVPHSIIGQRKLATQNLKAKIKETDKLLKNALDPLMYTYLADPVEYERYKDTRMIIDN